MTTPLSRCHLWHVQLCRDPNNDLHRLTKCHQCRWCCIRWDLRLNNRRNLQAGRPLLLISSTDVGGCIAPAWLGQFVNLPLLLPKLLHVMLYCLESVPVTQPGVSSLLTLLSYGSSSSSSSSSQSCLSLKLAISLRLSPMAFNIFSNVLSGFVFVNPAFSSFLLSSCSCLIALCASFRVVSPQLSLYPHDLRSISRSLHGLKSAFFNISSLQTSFWIASRATLHVIGPFRLRSCTCYCVLVDIIIWSAMAISRIRLPVEESGFLFGTLIIVFCVDFVDCRDVGCCKVWIMLATVPVLNTAGFIGLSGNGLTRSKIDDFSREPSH